MTKRKALDYLPESLMVLFYLLLIPAVNARGGLFSLSVTSVMNIAMDIAAIAVVITLLGRRPSSGRGVRVFPYLLYVEFLALYTDIFAWLVDGVPGLRWVNILDNTIFYFCSILLAFLYLLFVLDFLNMESKVVRIYVRLASAGAVLVTLLLLLNIFTGYVFQVDESNVYTRNFLYPLTFVYPMAVLATIPFFLFQAEGLTSAQKVALIGYCVAPILGAIIQTFTYGVSFLYILTLVALLFVYLLIYIKQENDLKETRSTLNQKEEHLDEQRQLILLSQIRPKYILSALSTISELCLTNSEEACRLTNAFSDYLRHNLDAMSGANVDSFLNELANIERFAEVEEKRLGDRACIIYDIGPTNFMVPVLTVQPLVENAVARSLAEGMEDIWVWVRTKEDEGNFYIMVENNSFATKLEDLEASDEIKSVRGRLESLSKAKLSFSVHEGNGCSITITIPRT